MPIAIIVMVLVLVIVGLTWLIHTASKKQLEPAPLVTQAQIDAGKYGHPFNPVEKIKNALKTEAPPEGYWWDVSVGAKENHITLFIGMRDQMTQNVEILDEVHLDTVTLSGGPDDNKSIDVSEYYRDGDPAMAADLFEQWAKRIAKQTRIDRDSKYGAVYEQEIVI